MSKFIGFIVGAIVLTIGIATGNVGLIIQGGAMILTQAIIDLTAPKAPARNASEMTIALGEQPRRALFGETFTAGTLVDGFDYGGKYDTDWEVLIIRLADHKCQSLTGFYVDNAFIPYTHDGVYAQFDGHHFKLYFRADTSTDPLPTIVTDNWPNWESSDIGQSGCDVIVAYLADAPQAKQPAWPGGRPHFGFVVKGKLCYDPRKDDTVTGGSGTHRWDDATTWEWTTNAEVCWYNFERGVYANDDTSDQTKLLVGRGLSQEESPGEYIFADANLCDEEAASVFPFQILSPALSLQGASFSPDYTKLVIGAGVAFQTWDVSTRTLISSSSLSHNVGSSHVAVNDDGSFYASSGVAGGVYLVSAFGGMAQLTTDVVSGGLWNTALGLFGRNDTPSNQYLEVGGSVVATPIGFAPNWYFDELAGDTIAVGGKSSGGSYISGFGFYNLSTATQHLITTGTSGATFALDNGNGQYFVRQGNSCYLIDKSTFAITAGPVTFTSNVGDKPFVSSPQGSTDVWIGPTRISTQDLSIIETINPGDWTSTGIGSDADYTYDFLNDAIWSRNTLESFFTVRFLHRHGGYRISGPVYANQEFLEVEEMFATATAGNIITHEGAVLLEVGQAKSVVASFTDHDLLVSAEIRWNQGFLSESDPEWVNTVVGTYVEPDQKWNSHDAPVLRDNSDIVADGKPREQKITMRLVRYQPQALRVAEINRRLGRLWGRATVKLGPRFCEIEEGDWISWTSARYGFTKTFRVDAYQIDEKWQITLNLREINGSVYADDATFPIDSSIPRKTPPPIDIGAPTDANWTLTATTLTSAGTVIPDLHLVGDTSDDINAEAVIVEYWKDDGVLNPLASPDSIPWIQAGRYPPSSTFSTDITSVTGGATYYTAISYVVSGQVGDRLVQGPVTLANVDVSGAVNTVINALPWKLTVRAKTTAALAANTYANGTSGVGATLTGNSNAALAAQDGVTLVVGNRLLVANEATGSHNGIYIVTQVGDGSHPYILTRATDADSAAELVNATVKVSEGTIAADQEWQCTTDATITIGSTTLTWTQSNYTDEQAQDAVFSIVSGTGLLIATYNDAGNAETLDVPAAVASDLNTGSNTTKAVTSDALAGSVFGKAVITLQVSDPNGSAITTGDGKAYYRVPSALNGMNLVSVAGAVTTVSSSGIPTVQIANTTHSVDMLSTKLTIDASETDSSTAATPAVIDGAHDDVATGDMLRIDIDVAGTGAKGLQVEMQFQLP